MNWHTVALELGLCGWIAVLLIGDLMASPARRTVLLGRLATLGVLVLAGVLWWQRGVVGAAFDPMFVLDRFAYTFKWLFLVTALVVVLMIRLFAGSLSSRLGEFYLLIFSALLGAFVLASATDLLLLFVGLELMTFSLYVMSAYVKTDPRSIEAGMKYLIMGSISSGFLIYGVSLLYGAAGGTSFEALRQLMAGAPVNGTTAAGLLLVMAGLGFKIAAVPFHLWVPDVYEGAPTPVVAFLSVGSKMAGAVALLRLLYAACLPAHALWGGILAVLSAATMLYGNLAAIPQTNIKRLLGYSSIGHAGYLLMGLSTATPFGAQAVGMYLLAYLVSNLTAFLVVVIVSQAIGTDNLDGYNGLSRRSPLLAASLFIALLSLAGVPPLAGFVGKLFVLLATVEIERLWLVAIGAINVAISLYYYLMVVRRMYLLTPSASQPIAVSGLSRTVLLLLLLGIVAIGTFQEPFLRLISSAVVF
ncbi:MAG: NADH-quinone oxidoreductase subunit N [Candidatus Omnitrophica bacterium]|nr:NADH-quinone oxidoreductase subunit N [Candidatus Omnitrophota bacterium]